MKPRFKTPRHSSALARTTLLTAAVVLLAAVAAHACNVPVFRYALERWRADPYRIVVFHRGPLTDAEREILLPLEEQQDQGLTNVEVRRVDVNELKDPADEELFASLENPELPLLAVRYPEYLHIDAFAWKGPLSGESVAKLADSPVRQELIRRLVAGETAVWLFLESGDAEKDEPARKLLEKELKQLEQEVTLPELSSSPEDQLLAGVPLRVAFSLLRVSREDPAEQALIEMLLHSESDLAERSDPMVFPVFGRGRALLPLVGAGITAENIYDSGAFLVGPCSCQVKELNPGFDLLLTAEWDTLVSQEGTPIAAVASPAPPEEAELVPIPSGAPPSAAVAETTPAADTSAADTSAAAIPAPPPTMAPPGGKLTWVVIGVACVGALAIVGLVAIVFRGG